MIPAATDPASRARHRRTFQDLTGKVPEGLWQAPGRVNLIGEHTDYNGGFVLPIAINRQTVVAGRVRDDDQLRTWSLQQDSGPSIHHLGDMKPGSVRGWAAYVAGTAWALAEVAGSLVGADLVIDSDVPVGAGLSSSAALEISSGLAMAHLNGVDIDLQDLAIAAQKAENDFVGVPCGIMDQMICATAKGGHALLIDTLTLQATDVPFRPEDLGAAVVVIDTRTTHDLSDGEYSARREGCRKAAGVLGVSTLRSIKAEDLTEALRRLPEELACLVRHVVTENDRVVRAAAALERGDLGKVGSEMNASHESLRDDYRVSSPELDLAVDVARLTGAYGARMTGGGFGGSAIALLPADRVASLEKEVKSSFEKRGMNEPAFFQVSASAGCSRIWP